MPLSRRALLGAAAAAVAAACSAERSTRRATPAASSPAGGGTPPSPPAAGQTPVATGPAVEVLRGSSNRPEVALTFHGAGSAALATALLNEAERGGARLTVLAVGSWLQDNPQLARRILDGGHELGNHTFTHPSLGQLSETAVTKEVAGCADVLTKLTGSRGAYFRPSGIDRATPLMLAVAGAAGYRTSLGFDVDPRDYQDPGSAAVGQRLLAAVRPGSVVSLHLGHQGTVDALPAILDGLRGKGLRPVTVSTLLA
ncbi:MAG: polysaccharide deacetylase family protein [Actinomycetota bacterium]|nr:polysaccharide deacetylase family protein [Actinomycetota bacterium]